LTLSIIFSPADHEQNTTTMMFLVQSLIWAILALLATTAPLPPLHAMDLSMPRFTSINASKYFLTISAYIQQIQAIYARNPTATTIIHTNGKRQSYQWVCNNHAFTFASLRVCQNYLQLTKAGDTCTADPNDVEKGRLCANTNLRVTGLAWNGKKTSVECQFAGDAVAFLTERCGMRGGEFL
jgi:hypothetical protein